MYLRTALPCYVALHEAVHATNATAVVTRRAPPSSTPLGEQPGCRCAWRAARWIEGTQTVPQRGCSGRPPETLEMSHGRNTDENLEFNWIALPMVFLERRRRSSLVSELSLQSRFVWENEVSVLEGGAGARRRCTHSLGNTRHQLGTCLGESICRVNVKCFLGVRTSIFSLDFPLV